MSFPYKKTIGLLLCGALLLTALPIHANALTLTAVDDTLLPLTEATMPARLGGELYVPYEVFARLGVEATQEADVLTLSAGAEQLIFSPAQGYVYDQNQNSYSSPAYDRNDTVYVPVKLCCGKFGFSYSTIAIAGETVLRITDQSSQSDSEFTAANTDEIESMIEEYTQEVAPEMPSLPKWENQEPIQTPVQTPITPSVVTPPVQSERPAEPVVIPKVEETPIQKPIRVYFSFWGSPNEYTASILDALQQANQSATFFLAALNPLEWQEDAIRRIAAEGHTLALLLEANEQMTPEGLVNQVRAANERLALLTGSNTRILACTTSFGQMTLAHRDALIEAGYRLWDATVDAGDDVQTAAMAYAVTARRFSTIDSSVVLRLHHSSAAVETFHSIRDYMARQNIPASQITLYTTPLNDASDPR